MGRISLPRRLSTIFVDQRLALVLFKRDPVLPNHGIHRFFVDFIWIMVEISTRKGISSRRIEQGSNWPNSSRRVRLEPILNIYSARRTFS